MRRRLLAGTIAVTGVLFAVAAGCGGEDDETANQDRDAQTKVGVEAPGIIAFRRYADAAETQGVIFTIRPDGTDERQVTRPPDGASDEFPAVSPNGRRIAWERCRETEPCRVYTAEIDGSGAKAIELTCTLKPCDAANIAWHPDGDRVVVTRASGRVRRVGDGDQIQRSELVEVNLTDGRQRTIARIDDWQGDLTSASWSPDGRRLAADRWFSAFSPRPGRRIDVVPAAPGRRKESHRSMSTPAMDRSGRPTGTRCCSAPTPTARTGRARKSRPSGPTAAAYDVLTRSATSAPSARPRGRPTGSGSSSPHRASPALSTSS